MRQWYNIEFNTTTRTMLKRVENFREWLYDHDIKHEISDCSVGNVSMVHFEIFENSEELNKTNDAIDTIVYFDSI